MRIHTCDCRTTSYPVRVPHGGRWAAFMFCGVCPGRTAQSSWQVGLAGRRTSTSHFQGLWVQGAPECMGQGGYTADLPRSPCGPAGTSTSALSARCSSLLCPQLRRRGLVQPGLCARRGEPQLLRLPLLSPHQLRHPDASGANGGKSPAPGSPSPDSGPSDLRLQGGTQAAPTHRGDPAIGDLCEALHFLARKPKPNQNKNLCLRFPEAAPCKPWVLSEGPHAEGRCASVLCLQSRAVEPLSGARVGGESGAAGGRLSCSLDGATTFPGAWG